MKKLYRQLLIAFILGTCFSLPSLAQRTDIRGFADAITTVKDRKLSFGLGEQDLFITSTLNDRFSFLGETVFRPSFDSSTHFEVSIERIVLKYNLIGNHNILLGKHHTPVNYWNDTYHHGRVFFPTIDRPLIFNAGMVPLHTTGVSLQGQNLGKYKFGYDLMIGNGLGSNDIFDNDFTKSITAAVHVRPVDGLRLGMSYYHDVIAKGSQPHDYPHPLRWRVKQELFNGSVAYFKDKVEVLSELMYANNVTDSTGTRHSIGGYAYAGYKIREKIVPYVRFDVLDYDDRELYFHKDNTTSFVAGVRYEINYLAVVKLEFQHDNRETAKRNTLTAQLAIGF